MYWSFLTRESSVLTFLSTFLKKRHLTFFIYPKVNIRKNKSKIKIKRQLVLGRVWELAFYHQSELRLLAGSSLRIDKFTFYTGFDISVNRGAKLTIGSGYANTNTKIDCYEEINIGNDVAISHNVIIRDSDNHSITGQSAFSAPIIIGNHVWIGMNAIILKGVTIGDGAVIAAGSIVTHDIPPNSLAAGIPAKVIRKNIEWGSANQGIID